jgi:thioredoxin 1
MTTSVITEMTMDSFKETLKTNPGIFIIKFGAEWCGPCKKIEPCVHHWIDHFSQDPRVQFAIIDIDENFDVYAFLKNKRMVNGIPVMLCYKKGNLTWVPDNTVVGANEKQLDVFFEEVQVHLRA